MHTSLSQGNCIGCPSTSKQIGHINSSLADSICVVANGGCNWFGFCWYDFLCSYSLNIVQYQPEYCLVLRGMDFKDCLFVCQYERPTVALHETPRTCT